MGLHLPGQPPLTLPDNRQHETIIITQEPLPFLPLPPSRRFTRLHEEGLVFVAQPAEATAHGLIVAGIDARGQDTHQELREALREVVRGGGLRGRGGLGAGEGGGEFRGRGLRGEGGGEGADGFAVRVHGDLEARPEEHVDAVDVAVKDGDLAALELKGEALVQADAEEDAEAVEGGVDEVLDEGAAKREGGFEDIGEFAGERGEGLREEVGEEGVFRRGVVEEGTVEGVEGGFEEGGGGGGGQVGGEGGSEGGGEDVEAAGEGDGGGGRVGRASGGGGGGFGGTEGGGVGAEGVGFFEVVEGDLGKGLAVAGEVCEEVPAHGVDVGAAEVFGEGGVVVGEEGVEGFVVEEGLLLDYLSVDAGGTEGFDCRDEIVSDSLYCLRKMSIWAMYLRVNVVYLAGQVVE